LTGSIDVQVALSRPAVPATQYTEQPLYALLDLIPQADAIPGTRSPLNLALVVDSSATMHNFQMTAQEREFWITLAISRDEMERGEADAHQAVYWSGQTLTDMQGSVRKPMTLAVDAIKSLLATLLPEDRITVIAFADRVHTVFSAADRVRAPDQCLAQLDLLAEQRLPVDIGLGTQMAEALRVADVALEASSMSNGVSRMIIISDGIVQDAEATLMTVAGIQENGLAITTLGVGEEFDEEFLTRVADNSRGDYYYAPDSAEITQRLTEEMTTLQAISLTDVHLAVRGLSGAVVQDIALVRPAMTLFDEIYTEDDWTRARIGDISSTARTGILLQIAPAPQSEGRHPIVEVQLTWAGGLNEPQNITQKTIEVIFTDDPLHLSETDPVVTDLVDRFQIYRYEREAQRAAERGDVVGAQEKLGAATRALRLIGEEQLAEDMEGQIAALSGAAQDPSRAKRIKATTRRLAGLAQEDNTPTT
jgi:Ca-activated chloride channel family protein